MNERAEASSRFYCRNQAPRFSLGILLTAVAVCRPALSSPSGSVTTTVYVGRHFEVRDHDQPTKYVFDGSIRVAEITGSLSSNLRVQRLRLYSGWNLCSVAVSGPFPASGAEAISAAYQWNSGTGDYSQITLGQSLAAGAVLWIKAGTNADVSVLGAYSDPTPQPVQAGGAYFPGAGLEAWSLALPDLASSWDFDASTGQWLNHLAGDLATVSGPPPTLSPGEAFYLQAAAPASLEIPDPTLRIRYYHEDHLGSSSVITDASGSLVEETAFYPFGTPRNEYKPRQIHEPYQFTQKERDLESGLHYFGKRFYHSILGKWLSTDPMEEKGGGLNLYAYANQNPMKYYDPNGGEVEMTRTITTTKEQGKITHYKISVSAVLINQSKLLDDKNFTKKDLEAFANSLSEKAKKQFTGSEGGVSWELDLKIHVVEKGADTGKNHVFFLRDPEAKTSGGGDAVVGGTHMTIYAYNLVQHRPTEEERDSYARNYKSPEGIGEHELFHNLGLSHLEVTKEIKTEEDRENVMYSHREWDAQKITKAQIENVYKEYSKGSLNKYDK